MLWGVKEKITGPKWYHFCAKAMIPNCRFDLSKTPNQSVWNVLVNINEIICHVGLFHPPWREEKIYVIKTLVILSPHPQGHPGLKLMLSFLLSKAPPFSL